MTSRSFGGHFDATIFHNPTDAHLSMRESMTSWHNDIRLQCSVPETSLVSFCSFSLYNNED